jgi:uncharacterized protein (UPF0212 family)
MTTVGLMGFACVGIGIGAVDVGLTACPVCGRSYVEVIVSKFRSVLAGFLGGMAGFVSLASGNAGASDFDSMSEIGAILDLAIDVSLEVVVS